MRGLLGFAIVVLVSCADYKLESMHLGGNGALFVGDSVKLVAGAIYSGGSDGEGRARDVSDLAHWISGDPLVASVKAGGWVTAHKPGSAIIFAEFQGIHATPLTVQVSARPASMLGGFVNREPTP